MQLYCPSTLCLALLSASEVFFFFFFFLFPLNVLATASLCYSLQTGVFNCKWSYRKGKQRNWWPSQHLVCLFKYFFFFNFFFFFPHFYTLPMDIALSSISQYGAPFFSVGFVFNILSHYAFAAHPLVDMYRSWIVFSFLDSGVVGWRIRQDQTSPGVL